MIKSEIITIGAELLQGRTLNTNSQYLSRELTALDFQVFHHQTCDDDAASITAALNLAFSRADLIMVTGGLGPTPDDITRKVVADYFGSELIFHAQQYQHIQKFFKKLGKKPSPITKEECYFPKAGAPILNQYGIALGFFVPQNKKLLICLPGVPRELIGLFENEVRSILKKHYRIRIKTHELSVSLIGLDEARAMRMFGKDFFKDAPFGFGSYPMDGRLVLRFRSGKKQILTRIKKILHHKFSRYIYCFDDVPLEEVVARAAIKKRCTITAAESCTGGLISKRLTDVAGSSKFFLGSLIAYDNKVKMGCLRVSSNTLKREGAVSRSVAIQMARGVRELLNSDLSVSVTGIAGPGGATPKKPVGLVWIGISTSRKNFAQRFHFLGNRDRIRRLASDQALRLIQKNL